MKKFAALMPIQSTNPYEILGLSIGIHDADTIKKAYQRAVKTNHPDVFTDHGDKIIAHDNFIKIKNAAEDLIKYMEKEKAKVKSNPSDKISLTLSDAQEKMVEDLSKQLIQNPFFKKLNSTRHIYSRDMRNGFWLYKHYRVMPASSKKLVLQKYPDLLQDMQLYDEFVRKEVKETAEKINHPRWWPSWMNVRNFIGKLASSTDNIGGGWIEEEVFFYLIDYIAMDMIIRLGT